MATLAGNAAVHVSGVVEVDVVGRLVDAHPFDGLAIILRMAGIHRTMQRLQLGAILLHVLVTVPAGIAGRNVGVTSDVDKGVTVATVQTELVNVDLVRKGNRLTRLIPYPCGFWSRVVAESEGDASSGGAETHGNFQRQQIGPAGKNVCHGEAGTVRGVGLWSK